MSGPVERIAAFVDDLIHNRRPCRFMTSPAELAALRAAAELTCARPGVDLPDRQFIDHVSSYISVTVRSVLAECRPPTFDVRERRFP